jgi:hypothetical protein
LGDILGQASDPAMHFIDVRSGDLLRISDYAANTDEIPDTVILFFDDPFQSVEPFFRCHADTLSQISAEVLPPM